MVVMEENITQICLSPKCKFLSCKLLISPECELVQRFAFTY